MGKIPYPRKCKNCNASILDRKLYSRHTLECGKFFTCKVCNLTCSSKRSLLRHLRQNCPTKHGLKCPEENCTCEFSKVRTLLDHLEREHFIDQYVRTEEFDSFDSFNRWKEAEGRSTFSYFRKISGPRLNAHSYYYCQFYKQKGNIPDLNCTARMLVRRFWNKVKVTFLSKHNHPLTFSNTKFHPYSTKTRKFIKQCLENEMHPKEIIKEIQCNLNTEKLNLPSKDILISTGYIRAMKYRMKSSLKNQDDESKSIQAAIQDLINSDDNPIFICKYQGEELNIGPDDLRKFSFSDDTFILGIQKKRQLVFFKQGLNRVICVDNSHLHELNITMLTFIIVDQFGCGYPAAYLITNKVDENVVTLFLQSLVDRSEIQEINAIVTDDNDTIIKGINNVYGSEVKHFFSSWHLLRTWFHLLSNKVSNKSLSKSIFHSLYQLHMEENIDSFKSMLCDFLTEYESSAKYFVDYFKSNYVNRCNKWALCYRDFPQGQADTNSIIGSFRNHLKPFYKEIKNKKICELLNFILNIENDYFFKHITITYNSSIAAQPETMSFNFKHENGLKISPNLITRVKNNKWNVYSTRSEKIWYIVRRINENCPIAEHCVLKGNCSCNELCDHLYTCTCPDNNYNCEHIHRIHSLAWGKEMEAIGSNKQACERDEINILAEGMIGSVKTYQLRQKMKDMNKKIFNFIDSLPVNLLEPVSSLIEDALDLCHGSSSKKLNPVVSMCHQVKSLSNDKLNEELSVIKSQNQEQDCHSYKEHLHKIQQDYHTAYNTNQEECSEMLEEFFPNNIGNEVEISFEIDESLNTSDPENYEKFEVLGLKPHKIKEILFTVHDFSISRLHLKSININISEEENKLLKLTDPNFERGWLHDNVIDAFISSIAHGKNNFQYIDSCTSQLLSTTFLDINNPFNKLCNNIIIPCNPGSHWQLLYFNVADKFLVVLDPLKSAFLCDYVKNVMQNSLKFINCVFNVTNTVWILKKNISYKGQEDECSCGVYICWYAECLIKKLNLNDKNFDCCMYRFDIFNCLLQNQTKNFN